MPYIWLPKSSFPIKIKHFILTQGLFPLLPSETAGCLTATLPFYPETVLCPSEINILHPLPFFPSSISHLSLPCSLPCFCGANKSFCDENLVLGCLLLSMCAYVPCIQWQTSNVCMCAMCLKVNIANVCMCDMCSMADISWDKKTTWRSLCSSHALWVLGIKYRTLSSVASKYLKRHLSVPYVFLLKIIY